MDLTSEVVDVNVLIQPKVHPNLATYKIKCMKQMIPQGN